MIRRFSLLALLLAVPAVAAAQYGPRYGRPAYGPPLSGPTLSAWLGVGFPTGMISNEGDGALGDVVRNDIPIGVGLGYRFNPMFHAGLFFEGAPLGIKDQACLPGDPCGGSDFRFGVDAQLHLGPFQTTDPWFGIGLGYEWLHFDATGCDSTGACFAESFHYSGWLFPRLAAGIAFAVSPTARIGPYVTYSAGEFSNVDTTSAGSQSINNPAFHGWLEIGVRGNLGL